MSFAPRLFRDDFPQDHDWSTSTLREIFDGWIIPQILRDPLQRDRPATDSTLEIYRNAIAWWEITTGNPRANVINDDSLRAFITGMKTAFYRRGRGGCERKLVEATQAKHVQQIRTLLDRLHADGRKPNLPILKGLTGLRKRNVDHQPKPTPDMETFKLIIAKLDSATKIKLCAPKGVQPVDFWRSLLGTLYCLGFRLSTTLAIRWEWFEQAKVNQLRLPSDANFKTHKSAIRPVPDWLLVHWRRQDTRFRTGDWPISSEGCVFGETPETKARIRSWKKALSRSWKRLQLAARPNAKPYSLQSLRRLHGAALRDTGFEIAARLAQEGLQHSSRHITEAHYAGILERAILQLPAV